MFSTWTTSSWEGAKERAEGVEQAEAEGYATLSITRANYDVKLKSIILGVPTLTSISDSKRRDRVLYRGMVHEPPTVSGKVFELPDDYFFIIHLCSFDWRKMFFLYISGEPGASRRPVRLIRRALWHLSPFSALTLMVYRFARDFIAKKFHVNTITVLRALYPSSLNEVLVQTLIRFMKIEVSYEDSSRLQVCIQGYVV